MKVSEILNESSELEKLRDKLSREQELYAKIDHPSSEERQQHEKYVSQITAQINKLRRDEKPSPTEPTEPKEDKKAAFKQRQLDKAEADVKKAQEQLRLAKTDREKKSWKANLEVAKFTLRKAQSQMK